jgi:hypothetical protein
MIKTELWSHIDQKSALIKPIWGSTGAPRAVAAALRAAVRRSSPG